MKKLHFIFAIMALCSIMLTTVSCNKNQDLSGYMTKEEWEAWQNEHNLNNYVTHEEFEQWVAQFTANLTAYMTHEEFQEWLYQLANDLATYMSNEEFQAWWNAHSNELNGHMTQAQFQEWLIELSHDMEEYMTLAEFQEWVSQHANQQINLATVYNFNVNYPAGTDVYYVSTTYSGLVGHINDTDILLVYFYINHWGTAGWVSVPFETGNLTYVYSKANNGTLTFSCGRALYTQANFDPQSFNARAIVIPATIYTSMIDNGVNINSYDEVVKACNLEK